MPPFYATFFAYRLKIFAPEIKALVKKKSKFSLNQEAKRPQSINIKRIDCFSRSRKRGRLVMLWIIYVVFVLAVLFLVMPLVLSYIFLCVGFPRAKDKETPENYGLSYRNFSVVTSDGVNIKGWFIPGSSKATIIVVYGGIRRTKGLKEVTPGGELSVSMLPLARFLHEGGYNVILYDRRLTGESGRGLLTRSAEDVYAIVQYIKSQSLDMNKIGLLGHCAGGWISIMAAGGKPGLFRAVVADAPIPNLKEGGRWFQAASHLPAFPFYNLFLLMGRIWVRDIKSVDEVSSNQYVSRISPSAFFLIVEARDQFFPSSSFERLYDLAGEPKQIWKDIDAAHTEAHARFPEEYKRRVLSFYDTYLQDSKS